MKKIIAACTLTLIILILSPALYGAELFFSSSVIKPKVRVEAPAFTLTSLDASELGLTDFKDKIILLNFWATWCAPCREEMPDMEILWQTLKEAGLVVIAVAEDRGGPKAVREFAGEHNITFPILLDPAGSVRRAYEVTGLPTSYIIGRDRKISGKVIGARDWDGTQSIKFFKTLLNKERD
jgi:peroxiredoxin